MDLNTDADNVTIVTRGHLHPLPVDCPVSDIEFDLRRLLSDPAHRPEGDMLDLTGLDETVRQFVLDTRGAKELVSSAVPLIFMMAKVKRVTVMVGCAGGKHRAAAVGQELATQLERFGVKVKVTHLHVHLPRVIRA